MTPHPSTRTLWKLAAVVVAAAVLTAWPAQSTLAQSKPDPKKTDQKTKPQDPEDETPSKEIEAKACPAVDVKFDAKTDKKQHPVPEPPAGKAMVFVVRPTMMGNKIQTKLAVDGEWKGGNRGDNYFFFPLDPGEHYFCSRAENTSVLVATVEAGKTYFLQQKISMGFMKARTKLVLLDEAEGRTGLEKTHLSIFTAKVKK